MLKKVFTIFCMAMVLLAQGCASYKAPLANSNFIDTHKDNFNNLHGAFSNPISLEKAKPKDQIECLFSHQPMVLNEAPIISLSYIEADIREVLLEVGLIASIPIVFDETVEGYISIDFYDYSIEETLALILSPGGYVYRVMENYILIGSPHIDSPAFSKLSETCSYNIKHQNPMEIVSSLSPMYRQYIHTRENSSKLSITAPPSIMKRLLSHIKQIDISPPQVKLEMSIIEVSADAMSILGVSWNAGYKNPQTQQLSQAGILDWKEATPVKTMMLGHAPTRNIHNSIHALEENGQAEIKATPSIVTLSGKEANFSSMQTVWLPYQVENGNGRSKELNYGIEMKIVPHISDNNNIKLNIINASVSDYTVDNNGVPNITSHSVTNTVNVDNGDYLILGGLLQEKTRKANHGIPKIAEIPGLGWFFGGKKKVRHKREVLILIRPVIQGDHS